jgi:NAD(P)-dependent dehydrogenase (short-subunit alcohol dehydrogenase family)
MSELIASRFGARPKAREVVEGVDLTGRTAIVTGGGSGIGVETAKALALAGADVVLAVRRPEAASAVAAEIEAEAGEPVRTEPLDLSSFASIRAFAARWGDAPLSILVNNAGVMACPLSHTEDGLEMQIGTNHFGHFLLATLLAPALERGADTGGGARSRVVALSSIGHRRSGVHFEDPFFRDRPYDKWEAYGQAKTANALFAVGFDARFADRGINANAVHPGGIMTPLQRHLPREEMIAFGWIDEAGNVNERFKSPEQGAATSVWAAVGSELEGVGGLYLEDCAQAAPFSRERPMQGVMPYAVDPTAAGRLWELSEATTAPA